jgi:hypothetical protein
MQPTRELLDELHSERIRAAQQMPLEDKLLAGPQLFDLVCKIMADGVRDEHPDANEARVKDIVRERLALSARLEARSES